MKSAHEEGGIRMQQMVLAALENLKRNSATIDVTNAFVLLCFQYLTHRLSIVVVGKVITSKKEVCHDWCRETIGNK